MLLQASFQLHPSSVKLHYLGPSYLAELYPDVITFRQTLLNLAHSHLEIGSYLIHIFCKWQNSGLVELEL